MNKKVYETINQFVKHLSDAEDLWRVSPTTSDKLVETLTKVLVSHGFGKTDEELVTSLLKLVASIVTKPAADDAYPTINFMHGKTD